MWRIRFEMYTRAILEWILRMIKVIMNSCVFSFDVIVFKILIGRRKEGWKRKMSRKMREEICICFADLTFLAKRMVPSGVVVQSIECKSCIIFPRCLSLFRINTIRHLNIASNGKWLSAWNATEKCSVTYNCALSFMLLPNTLHSEDIGSIVLFHNQCNNIPILNPTSSIFNWW